MVIALIGSLFGRLSRRAAERHAPDIRDIFTTEALTAVRDAIDAAETQTSGQIRVILKRNADTDLAGRENIAHEQAVREFTRHRMHATKDHTGVLILLLWTERRFAIIGDTGINAKLPIAYWDGMAARLARHFRQDGYVRGLVEVVGEVGAVLAAHFPRTAGTTDELPDDVIVEDRED